MSIPESAPTRGAPRLTQAVGNRSSGRSARRSVRELDSFQRSHHARTFEVCKDFRYVAKEESAGCGVGRLRAARYRRESRFQVRLRLMAGRCGGERRFAEDCLGGPWCSAAKAAFGGRIVVARAGGAH